jgi:DNA helicase II / ATP-dependent DNA helicase PcrA
MVPEAIEASPPQTNSPQTNSPQTNSPQTNSPQTNSPQLNSFPPIDRPIDRPIDLDSAIAHLRDRLRPGQQRMADWTGGELAVSAVPGAGKSTGMAGAAAIAIARHRLGSRRQLVVVTVTRSAAANLKAKIRAALTELGLPPVGFSVQTLHGLALSIASRNPELSGLDLGSSRLITPTQSHRILRGAIDQWITAQPRLYQQLLEGQSSDGEETERLRRQSVLRTEVLPELALAAIHEAKSSGLSPEQLFDWSRRRVGAGIAPPDRRPDRQPSPSDLASDEPVDLDLDFDLDPNPPEVNSYNILAVAAGLYDRYEQLRQQRGLIDYDDMILAALRVLSHEQSRRSWQQQVFAVFEDEAQDSTPLQSRLLEILAQNPIGDSNQRDSNQRDSNQSAPNLIRVGDPNQAINSTFTPADPIFFRRFCDRAQPRNQLVTMDQAGRSTPILIDAANFVLDWVNRVVASGNPMSPSRPVSPANAQDRVKPFRAQHIKPVPIGDPQANANPRPEGLGLELHSPLNPLVTAELLKNRIRDLFDRDPASQVAILVRENKQGRFLAHQLADLAEAGIPIYEVGLQERHAEVPQQILEILQFIQRPHAPEPLKRALSILMGRQLIPSQDINALAAYPEQFLYPSAIDRHPDPEAFESIAIDPKLVSSDPPRNTPPANPIAIARRFCAGLLKAHLELPPVQLISFIALTLGYDAAELATADKLTDQAQRQLGGPVTLGQLISSLAELVSSERFEPIDLDNSDSKYTRSGQVTILTIHKSKGLDWDYVFVPFLQAQSIPGSLRVPPQWGFLGEFTLAEIARAQIRHCLHGSLGRNSLGADSSEGDGSEPNVISPDRAWQIADRLKQAEEYRLLYVAITRAKRLLWLSAEKQAPFSWHKPEQFDDRPPCPVIPALKQRFPHCVL